MKILLKYIINTIVDKVILWPFYYPIIYLMKEVKANNTSKSNGIGILALNPSRFRGDLEVLAQSGFKVYIMPYRWQTRVFHAYKDLKPGDKFKNPPIDSSISRDRARLRKYLLPLLGKIFRKKGIDCVIGAGLFYNQDLDWGAATTKIGYPYIVFHRENLVVNNDMYLEAKERANLLNEMGFVGTSIVFQNKIIKSIYDKYSGVNTDKIKALGATRMDQYVLDTKSKKNTLNNRRITLFTFPASNAIMTKDYNYLGWHQLHDKVHTSFVELARENPEIEFIIKHKGVGWEPTERLLSSLDAFNIPNLKIYGERSCDTHKLILESDVITGFCSTALLEAAIAAKPIIYPLFAEASDEQYNDFICFADALNMFDVATSNKEYKELLIKRMKHSAISKTVMELRESQFEKHVSSLKSDVIQEYSKLIINEVKVSNEYR